MTDPFAARPFALAHWPPTTSEWREIEDGIRRDPDWLAYYRYFRWDLAEGPDFDQSVRTDARGGRVFFSSVPAVNHRGEPENSSLVLDMAGRPIVDMAAREFMRPGRYWRYLPSALKQARAIVKRERELLDRAARWVGHVYFVRFGPPPRSGISRGRIRGQDITEKGVSVYEATFDHRRGRWSLEVPQNDTGWPTLDMHLAGNRHVYLLQGDVVGEGADGEPVLGAVRVVKKLHRCDVQVLGMYDPEHEGGLDCRRRGRSA